MIILAFIIIINKHQIMPKNLDDSYRSICFTTFRCAQNFMKNDKFIDESGLGLIIHFTKKFSISPNLKVISDNLPTTMMNLMVVKIELIQMKFRKLLLKGRS